MCTGGVGAFPARPAFQRGFQFPDRRIARTPDRIEGQARARLTTTAFDLKPTIPAVEALPDSRRRLCRAAVALHLDRPCLGFGAVGLTYGLGSAFARALRAYFRADDPATVDYPRAALVCVFGCCKWSVLQSPRHEAVRRRATVRLPSLLSACLCEPTGIAPSAEAWEITKDPNTAGRKPEHA
jgi:hypothetical protein